MTQKNPSQPDVKVNPNPKMSTAPKSRISFRALKAVVTVLLIVGLIIIILQIYYPGVFPWN
jgi:hypothetical protein